MKPELTHYLHGLKTGLAALLAFAITHVFNLTFGYWAVISTVIVMQVYVADSVEMCLYRLSGTLVGAAMGAGVVAVIPPTPFWTGVALFVSISICTFLTRYKTRYRMAAITLVIIIMTGIYEENILWFSLDRVLEIGIGILCAFLVSVLVFPRRKTDLLRQRMTDQAKACARICDGLVTAFNNRQQHVDEGPVDQLVTGVRENPGVMLTIRRHEARIYGLGEDFHSRVQLLGRCAEGLRTMTKILNSLSEGGHEIIMAKELCDLSRVSGNTLMAMVENRAVPSAVAPLDRLVQDMDEKLLNIRKEGLTSRFDLKRLVQVFSFYNALMSYAEDILAEAKKAATP